jgi:hypothetical protein
MPLALLGGVLGLIVGLASFTVLERGVTLWLAGGPARRIIVWQVLRLALTALCFLGIAQLGAAALISALAGFIVARFVRTQGVAR